MKNPWMSLWLSAANSITGAARGQMMAEASKAQRKMIADWQKLWLDALTGQAFTGRPGGRKR